MFIVLYVIIFTLFYYGLFFTLYILYMLPCLLDLSCYNIQYFLPYLITFSFIILYFTIMIFIILYFMCLLYIFGFYQISEYIFHVNRILLFYSLPYVGMVYVIFLDLECAF